jgi:transmembrane sensor
MTHLRELGRRVAEVQDDDRRRLSSTERAGASFIRALRTPSRRPRGLRLAVAVAAVAWVAAVWLTVPHGDSKGPIALTSGLPVGRSIVAPADREIPLQFSDGSRILLLPGTEAAVESLTKEGARVSVQRGRAEVAVRHRPDTHFALHAGPYQVSVTGTRFELEWLPDSARFELELEEGSVVVTTEKSSHAAVKMMAPQHLLIEREDWQLSPSRGTEPSGPSPSEAFPKAQPSVAVAPSGPVSTGPAVKVVSTAQQVASTLPSDWRALGRAGKYESAYRQAESLGISQLADSSSGPRLLDLAEVCRFAGHASESMSVLTKLRQRFPGTDGAAIAAFQLGRLSGSPGLSASWFRTYLKERPGGELAREASGRLLEALDQSGDRAGAAEAARSYLLAYPNGPHGPFARRLLGQ